VQCVIIFLFLDFALFFCARIGCGHISTNGFTTRLFAASAWAQVENCFSAPRAVVGGLRRVYVCTSGRLEYFFDAGKIAPKTLLLDTPLELRVISQRQIAPRRIKFVDTGRSSDCSDPRET
jgi:hypothetical protein